MFGYLILLFTILPALELILLIHIGSHIGTANTLFLIFFTGISGACLARLQGFYIIHRIQTSLNQGQMPTQEMMDGLMIFAGGILLLTPGFITDILGFLLLIPFARSIIKTLLSKKFQNFIYYREGGTTIQHPRSRQYSDRDFEDADFS